MKLASPGNARGVQLRNLLRSRDELDQGEMLLKRVTLIDLCGSVSARMRTHTHTQKHCFETTCDRMKLNYDTCHSIVKVLRLESSWV